MKNFHFQIGQSLIELLIVIGLTAIILPALLTGIISSREGKVQQNQRLQAIALLNETIEAVRSVRERGWSYINSISIGIPYHTEVSSPTWSLVTGEYTDPAGFKTTVIINNVNRGVCPGVECGKIVAVGGVLDPSSRKLVVTISWLLPYISSVTETLYITRYLDNDAHIDTTTQDFTDGAIHTGTVTRNPPEANGEVILGSGGGGGNWCDPNPSIAEQDLPNSGVANAVTATEGSDGNVIAFAGTGENSSGVSFAKVEIVGDVPSISSSIPATFNGYKTNSGVFGEDNFAYLGTDNNQKEIVIMSLTQYSDPPTNSKYLKVGEINLPGNVNGSSVFVANNKAYILSSDNKFYIYNLSSDRTTATLQNSGGLTISGAGKKVLVVGNYAYVATSATSNQFQIIDISNASVPVIVGQRTLGSSQFGVDVYVNTASSNPDRAYFVTSSSSGPEFFVIDISSKSNPTIIGAGYDTNGMSPTGVTVVTGNRAIVVGTGGTLQYQVLNITNETNPVACGPGLSYSAGINGVASVLKSTGYAYSYIITGDANAELKIILGGAGGGLFASAGNFVSDIVDAFIPTMFNRFDVTFIQPSDTSIGLQVAVADPGVGDCDSATYTFIGPGLTSDVSDLFTTGSPVPILSSGFYQNPGQCFRYKVYFSSNDTNKTPELRDFTLNYSP